MEGTAGWSVAVYLAGGDGLNEGMIRALKELRDVALSREGLSALAQFEPRNKIPRLFAFPQHPVEGAVTLPLAPSPRRARSPNALSRFEYLVDTPPGRGASAVELLSQFIRLGRSLGRAEHSMLVLSGHGNGAVGDLFGYRGPERSLSIQDLRRALASACLGPDETIDVIGMDCCNMSMVEVAFELAPYARFLVASESIVPNHGWPYRHVLDPVGALTPEAAASEIVRRYAEFYEDYTLLGMATHCAATDLRRVGVLEGPLARLSERLAENIDAREVWQPVVLAHWEAQSYKNEEYVDLVDFCERLQLHASSNAIQKAARDVIDAVGDVVTASLSMGASFQFSTGLSIYFPWSNDAAKSRGELGGASDLDEYKRLSFSHKTGWGEFLDQYLRATRRAAREVRPPRRPRPNVEEPAAFAPNVVAAHASRQTTTCNKNI